MISRPLIAIDIGTSSVKIAEVIGSGSKRKLKTLGLELLPANTVVNGEVVDAHQVLKTIRKLIHSLGIKVKGRRVALSMAGLSVIYKRVSLLPDEETDLGEQVFEEAKQQFHHDMSDMYFRFQEIPSKFSEGAEKTFLIVAGRIDVIEQYIELMHGLKMKVGVIDTDAFSLFNVFNFTYPMKESLILLANVGATSTQVIISYEGEYLFSREFFIGGTHITKKIAEDLSIDVNNAEGLKISASSGDGAIAKKVLPSIQTVNDQINAEIRQTIDFFLEHENIGSFSELNYAFMSGGGSLTLDLPSSLSAELKCPVQIINPFQKIDPRPTKIDTEYLLSHGAIYAVSVGLGLRKVKHA
ncbi:MAG: type IV pilus assembly protein PilM [Pseudobacteriovorax sp.]|nr:type IV pilus assembly protein PilM [Pseudobacteriovorax sp.]